VFLAQLDGSTDDSVAKIVAAQASGPETAEDAGLISISCAVAPRAKGAEITASLNFENPMEAALVVLEADDGDVWIDQTESISHGTHIQATAPMQYYGFGDMELNFAGLTVSVFGTNRAVEIQGCPG